MTWTNISGNLPDVPITALVVDPSDPNDLFVGSDVGVLRSVDGQSSTLLPDGRLLKIGGRRPDGLPAGSAIVDPRTGDATEVLAAPEAGSPKFQAHEVGELPEVSTKRTGVPAKRPVGEEEKSAAGASEGARMRNIPRP